MEERHIKIDCQIRDNGPGDCSASIAMDVNASHYDLSKFLHETIMAFIAKGRPTVEQEILSGLLADVVILLSKLPVTVQATLLALLTHQLKARQDRAPKDPAGITAFCMKATDELYEGDGIPSLEATTDAIRKLLIAVAEQMAGDQPQFTDVQMEQAAQQAARLLRNVGKPKN